MSSCKSNSITHAAAAPSNLDAATTMRSAEAELQHALELCARTLAKQCLNCPFPCAADPRMIPVQTNVFRNRPPDKLPHPSSGTHFVLQNTAFCASANSQKRISCETSLKNWKWKMWQQSFRARLPSKSESWRCENEAFVRDVPQKVSWRCKIFVPTFPERVKVEDVNTKLSL